MEKLTAARFLPSAKQKNLRRSTGRERTSRKGLPVCGKNFWARSALDWTKTFLIWAETHCCLLPSTRNCKKSCTAKLTEPFYLNTPPFVHCTPPHAHHLPEFLTTPLRNH